MYLQLCSTRLKTIAVKELEPNFVRMKVPELKKYSQGGGGGGVVQSFYGKKSVNLPLIATEGFSTVLDPAMYR